MRTILQHLKISRASRFTPFSVCPFLQSSTAHRPFSTRSFDPNPESTAAKVGEVILTTKHGEQILLDPLLNKGTGFLTSERERLGIRGLVPPRTAHSHAEGLQQGVKRVMSRYYQIPSNIGKYSYMIALQDRNETLFYRCLVDHIDELAPIIYTPTVGEACQHFGALFRRARGMYFCGEDRGAMHAMVFNWPSDDVEIIVVTDGSRILGLGDLGANGMAIPVGKLSLYAAAAGIHPSRCLPVMLDVGTNNEKLLEDDFYLGCQHKRIGGKEYFEIVDEFIRAVTERWPKVLIQFEDFSNEFAAPLLHKYRGKVLCFNDDIQGTGTVGLAGVLGAIRAAGDEDPVALRRQKIVICGAGSAGIGVASSILFGLKKQGLSDADARARIWLLDHKGALGVGRKEFAPIQQPWLRDVQDGMSLTELVEQVQPTILIGLSGTKGVFSESAIKAMYAHCPKPIIFPLSNPTNNAECTAAEAFAWTEGNCIFASGSPFDNVIIQGRKCYPSQANNFYTFPGIGLGAIAVDARLVTDSMLYEAARALALMVDSSDLEKGKIFPPLKQIRKVSENVAMAVALQAHRENVANAKPLTEEELRKHICDRMWDPIYGSMVRVDQI